mmetsp:Transcript_15923/g.40667  ORF Transcript_15923/g.40667 Transcript_15923/m.40667 type:complete len:212 (-) Transcript_15923:564-1199(-)
MHRAVVGGKGDRAGGGVLKARPPKSAKIRPARAQGAHHLAPALRARAQLCRSFDRVCDRVISKPARASRGDRLHDAARPLGMGDAAIQGLARVRQRRPVALERLYGSVESSKKSGKPGHVPQDHNWEPRVGAGEAAHGSAYPGRSGRSSAVRHGDRLGGPERGERDPRLGRHRAHYDGVCRAANGAPQAVAREAASRQRILRRVHSVMANP